MTELNRLLESIHPVSVELRDAARRRIDHLTKPIGSLGKLESNAARLVQVFGTTDLRIRRRVIFTFAADHGVAEGAGVSLYPRSVTGQMVLNFLTGGAAVNVLARQAHAEVRVIDAGTLTPIGDPRLIQKRIGPGTRNFLNECAMTREEAVRCLEWGADVFFEEYRNAPIDMAGVGDMGIGNSTSAAAVLCALSGRPAQEVAGRGTGLDDKGLSRKVSVIDESLKQRRPNPADAVDVLAKVGGFEIGEMAGCFLGGASRRCAMLVDGFISTAAAALAIRLRPGVQDYLFFSHQSAEQGHARALQDLKATPILDLEMRLGEGTGAAVAMHVLDCAVAMYRDMATFESAGVDTAT